MRAASLDFIFEARSERPKESGVSGAQAGLASSKKSANSLAET
jgi:hypothetical protein